MGSSLWHFTVKPIPIALAGLSFKLVVGLAVGPTIANSIRHPTSSSSSTIPSSCQHTPSRFSISKQMQHCLLDSHCSGLAHSQSFPHQSTSQLDSSQ